MNEKRDQQDQLVNFSGFRATFTNANRRETWRTHKYQREFFSQHTTFSHYVLFHFQERTQEAFDDTGIDKQNIFSKNKRSEKMRVNRMNEKEIRMSFWSILFFDVMSLLSSHTFERCPLHYCICGILYSLSFLSTKRTSHTQTVWLSPFTNDNNKRIDKQQKNQKPEVKSDFCTKWKRERESARKMRHQRINEMRSKKKKNEPRMESTRTAFHPT